MTIFGRNLVLSGIAAPRCSCRARTSPWAMIGVILLMGLVTKNAILLVDGALHSAVAAGVPAKAANG